MLECALTSMNVLIAYATNSGSTQAAAGIIAETLKTKGHTVDLRYVTDVKPEDIAKFDAVFFGSPSWDYEKLEGQPHEDMTAFLKLLKPEHIAGKKIALFAMGDKSYTHFGGAVDVMNDYMKKLNATVIGELLRIDRFFNNPDATKLVTQWAEKVANSLLS